MPTDQRQTQPFEAAYILPEGWVVLLPWVRTEEGYWWRPTIALPTIRSSEARRVAEHYARELNEWRDTHAAMAAEQFAAGERDAC